MDLVSPDIYIDIHTHTPKVQDGVIQLINLFPEQVAEKLPAFSFPPIQSNDNNSLFTLGLHPWYIKEENYSNYLKIIEEESLRPEIVAIGECGLDRVCDTPFDLQLNVFRQQVMISEKNRKPLLIHCVRASNEVIRIKKELKPQMPWIIHGYNSNLVTGQELIRHGFYLSLGMDLLNLFSNAFRFLKEIPKDQLFFETEDEKIGVESIYKRAASLLEIDLILLKKQIYSNFKKVYK